MKYLSAALAEVPRVKVPLGRAGGSTDAGDDALAAATALGDDPLFPDDVHHGLEHLQADVAWLGGGGLRDVEHPPDRTRHRRK